MLRHLKQLDWILIGAAILLVGIGLLSIYSSSMGRGDFLNFNKQLIFFGIGFFLMLIFSFIDWRFFQEDSRLILFFYLFCLLALFGLFFLGVEVRGVIRWYKLGPLFFDPIVPTSLVLIILLAKYFSKRHVEMYQVRHIFLSGLYVFLPIVLIFPQPDLGSVLTLVSLWIGILLVSGIKLRHFLILCLCGLIIFALSWTFLFEQYQKERVLSFLVPHDPLGANWSQNQSKIAIGSGGIFGQGFGRGSQTQHRFLPEPQTDFIFAAIAEEFGLVGVIILLTLFLLLFWRIIKIAISAENNFPRLFVVGFILFLLSPAFIHIGMNLGFLPVVGLSLPFISYGGSFLIAAFIGLGILQSIRIHTKKIIIF